MKRSTSIACTSIAVVSMLSVAGCAAPDRAGTRAEESPNPENCAVQEHAMGLRWQQQSAEAQALQSQTYRIAGERLEEKVKQAKSKDLAVITDLDETAIDNTKLLARDMTACHDYSVWDTWGQWELKGSPSAIPGAAEFFQKADELGVSIYYISDRTEENLDATIASLKDLDFPQVSKDQVMLLGLPKEERRTKIQKEHKVIMQLGDTLHDFSGDYANAHLDQQRQLVEKDAKHFGDDWFILPNPTYGSWEDAELDKWDAKLETKK
ncbi:5'-nucleotidase, lipoprotein e(P4) family [Arthrobacter sp. NPDC058097]|uniref:5'-nucleotidase, lipoprotein e(P4) family n=1 Tax=Arthrobacter sp. NPDC058097 TaxID=3346340 RepID=UPI0036DE7A68